MTATRQNIIPAFSPEEAVDLLKSIGNITMIHSVELVSKQAYEELLKKRTDFARWNNVPSYSHWMGWKPLVNAA